MSRRATLGVLVLALAAASCGGGSEAPGATFAPPTPDFGIQAFSGEPDGSANCADYAVAWQSPAGRAERATLTAVSGRDVALDLEGADGFEQLAALWCGDVDADGRFELATQRFTGGAHCCFSVRVDTLGGDTMLARDLGNFGGIEAENLDDDGPYELVGHSDALAGVGDIPFVATAPLPLVFSLRAGRYGEATQDFPDHVRTSLEEARRDLAAVAGGDNEQAVRGMALGVYGHYVLLGDADEGLRQIAELVGERVRQWVRGNADEVAAAIEDRE